MATEREKTDSGQEALDYWAHRIDSGKFPQTEYGFVDGIEGIHSEIDIASLETGTLFEPDFSIAHNPIVLLVGVSASGKDYLGDLAAEATGMQNLGTGTAIAKVAGVEGDEVRHLLPKDYLKAKGEAAADEVLKQVGNRPCFVNGHLRSKHYLVPDSDQDPKISGSPAYVELGVFDTKLNPAHVVVVVSDAEEIILRRENGNKEGRTRDVEDITRINLHQRLSVFSARELAIGGRGFSIIRNGKENVASNVEILAAIGNKIRPQAA